MINRCMHVCGRSVIIMLSALRPGLRFTLTIFDNILPAIRPHALSRTLWTILTPGNVTTVYIRISVLFWLHAGQVDRYNP